MKKLKYIIKCISHLNMKNMFVITNKIRKKTHKLYLFILLDIIYCGFKYGAGYYDYQEFEFYNLSKKERKTYLTRTKNNLIIKKYNNKTNFYKFNNKGIFNELFKKFLNREYMILDENNYKTFTIFIKKHQIIIVKPIDGEGGKGVEKYRINDKTNTKELFDTLLIRKQNLIEEYIIQNKEINKLYSDSVNTLRIFTFYDGVSSHVINSVFKIGNGGVTDNFSSGSMYTFLNNDGIIIVPAIDKDDNIFITHPLTKANIIGFKVPFYKKACDLVCDASKIVKDVKYIGWDVAITSEGPVIIEGNCYPGVFQIKPSLKRNMGLIPKYRKYMEIK